MRSWDATARISSYGSSFEPKAQADASCGSWEARGWRPLAKQNGMSGLAAGEHLVGCGEARGCRPLVSCTRTAASTGWNHMREGVGCGGGVWRRGAEGQRDPMANSDSDRVRLTPPRMACGADMGCPPRRVRANDGNDGESELRERSAAWAASTSSCKCWPCRLRSKDAGRAGR